MLIARWVLVAWSLIGCGIIIIRIRSWRCIRSREILLWSLSALVSGVIALLGYCRFPEWDKNEWLAPAMTGAVSVSVAGIAIGLLKLYSEGFARQVVPGLGVAGIALFIIGVLPQLGTPRRNSDKLECAANLKLNGVAMLNLLEPSQSFLPSVSGAPPTSWRVLVLPQVDAGQLFSKYDRAVPWDRPPNQNVAKDRSWAFSCPSSFYPKDQQGGWFTAYSMPTGPHTVGENPNGTQVKDITDGTGTTLLIVEASGSQIVWTKPGDVNVPSQPAGINLKGTKPGHSAGWLSSYHLGGVNVQMADGGIRFLSDKTDTLVLKRLATIDGGEKVESDEF